MTQYFRVRIAVSVSGHSDFNCIVSDFVMPAESEHQAETITKMAYPDASSIKVERIYG